MILERGNLFLDFFDFEYISIERKIYELTYYKKTNAFFYNGLIHNRILYHLGYFIIAYQKIINLVHLFIIDYIIILIYIFLERIYLV